MAVFVLVPHRSLYVDRYLMAFLPALLLMLAVDAVPFDARRRAASVLVACIALLSKAFGLGNTYTVPRYARNDLCGMIQYLEQNMPSAHNVVLSELGLELSFAIYTGQRLAHLAHPLSNDSQEKRWLITNSELKTHPAFWLATLALPMNVRRSYLDERGQCAFSRQAAFKVAMDAHFRITPDRWFLGLLLTEYRVVQ